MLYISGMRGIAEEAGHELERDKNAPVESCELLRETDALLIWFRSCCCFSSRAQALEDVEEALVRLENLLQKLLVCRSSSEKEQLKAVFDESSLITCRKFSVILCLGTTQLAAQGLHRLTLHQELNTQVVAYTK
ncbi:hypothetical protein Drorol1_Dr00015087 [Drosera rotundifolia]